MSTQDRIKSNWHEAKITQVNCDELEEYTPQEVFHTNQAMFVNHYVLIPRPDRGGDGMRPMFYLKNNSGTPMMAVLNLGIDEVSDLLSRLACQEAAAIAHQVGYDTFVINYDDDRGYVDDCDVSVVFGFRSNVIKRNKEDDGMIPFKCLVMNEQADMFVILIGPPEWSNNDIRASGHKLPSNSAMALAHDLPFLDHQWYQRTYRT